MKEKLAPVWLLAERELKDQFRDWRILFPLLFLSFLFPPLMIFLIGQSLDFIQEAGSTFNFDPLVPFSILIIGFFPVTVSLVVALESFVGEKERGTIEPLLGTPVLDWQLYFGKLLAGVILPAVASCTAIIFYLYMVQRQGLTLPPRGLMIQLLLLTFGHSFLMVSAAIVISTQSTSVKAANLLASFVIIPVAVLIQWESMLILSGDESLLAMAFPTVLILALILIRVGLAHFQREYLLGREIDSLNLKWLGRTFWIAFRGDADSLWKWYRVQVEGVLRRLRPAILLLVVIAIVSGVASYLWVMDIAPAYLDRVSDEQIDEILQSVNTAGNLSTNFGELSFGFIFRRNVRATLLIFGVGVVSFGVLGQIIYILNIGIIGGALALFNLLGFSASALFWAGVFPHGILELPAVMLASAGVLYFGVAMITPDPSRTMGEIMVNTLADWFKVFLGLVLPFLLIAALIEVYVTPHILLSVVQ